MANWLKRFRRHDRPLVAAASDDAALKLPSHAAPLAQRSNTLNTDGDRKPIAVFAADGSQGSILVSADVGGTGTVRCAGHDVDAGDGYHHLAIEPTPRDEDVIYLTEGEFSDYDDRAAAQSITKNYAHTANVSEESFCETSGHFWSQSDASSVSCSPRGGMMSSRCSCEDGRGCYHDLQQQLEYSLEERNAALLDASLAERKLVLMTARRDHYARRYYRAAQQCSGFKSNVSSLLKELDHAHQQQRTLASALKLVTERSDFDQPPSSALREVPADTASAGAAPRKDTTTNAGNGAKGETPLETAADEDPRPGSVKGDTTGHAAAWCSKDADVATPSQGKPAAAGSSAPAVDSMQLDTGALGDGGGDACNQQGDATSTDADTVAVGADGGGNPEDADTVAVGADGGGNPEDADPGGGAGADGEPVRKGSGTTAKEDGGAVLADMRVEQENDAHGHVGVAARESSGDQAPPSVSLLQQHSRLKSCEELKRKLDSARSMAIGGGMRRHRPLSSSVTAIPSGVARRTDAYHPMLRSNGNLATRHHGSQQLATHRTLSRTGGSTSCSPLSSSSASTSASTQALASSYNDMRSVSQSLLSVKVLKRSVVHLSAANVNGSEESASHASQLDKLMSMCQQFEQELHTALNELCSTTLSAMPRAGQVSSAAVADAHVYTPGRLTLHHHHHHHRHQQHHRSALCNRQLSLPSLLPARVTVAEESSAVLPTPASTMTRSLSMAPIRARPTPLSRSWNGGTGQRTLEELTQALSSSSSSLSSSSSSSSSSSLLLHSSADDVSTAIDSLPVTQVISTLSRIGKGGVSGDRRLSSLRDGDAGRAPVDPTQAPISHSESSSEGSVNTPGLVVSRPTTPPGSDVHAQGVHGLRRNGREITDLGDVIATNDNDRLADDVLVYHDHHRCSSDESLVEFSLSNDPVDVEVDSSGMFAEQEEKVHWSARDRVRKESIASSSLKDKDHISLHDVTKSDILLLSRALVKPMTSLRTIRIAGGCLDFEDVLTLAAALRRNTAVSGLSVVNCAIDCTGAELLGSAMRHSTGIAQLSLDGNRLGDSGLAALSTSLKHSLGLVTLCLGDQQLTDVSVLALVNIVANCKRLQVLNIDGRQFSAHALEQLQRAAKCYNIKVTTAESVRGKAGDTSETYPQDGVHQRCAVVESMANVAAADEVTRRHDDAMRHDDVTGHDITERHDTTAADNTSGSSSSKSATMTISPAASQLQSPGRALTRRLLHRSTAVARPSFLPSLSATDRLVLPCDQRPRTLMFPLDGRDYERHPAALVASLSLPLQPLTRTDGHPTLVRHNGVALPWQQNGRQRTHFSCLPQMMPASSKSGHRPYTRLASNSATHDVGVARQWRNRRSSFF